MGIFFYFESFKFRLPKLLHLKKKNFFFINGVPPRWECFIIPPIR
nr:MAG TPA: hypothetical protein [Caudoviricetes sp.]